MRNRTRYLLGMLLSASSVFAAGSCADFSGKWVGHCQDLTKGGTHATESKFEQLGCEKIVTVGGDDPVELRLDGTPTDVLGFRMVARWEPSKKKRRVLRATMTAKDESE